MKFRAILLFPALLALAACQKDPVVLSVFRELPAPVTADLSSVWFADSLHGVATGGSVWAGTGGLILSTADGGVSWQTDTLVTNRLECVMFDAGGQAYACGMDGLVLHRPPGERHWIPFRQDWCWYRACHFPTERRGVLVGGEGYRLGLLRQAGPNRFWEVGPPRDFPNELHAAWFSDSLTAHVAGYGWLMRSDDAGTTWQRLPVPDDFYRGLHFPTPEIGYACGYSGFILKTTDGGRSWRTIREGGSMGRKNRPFRSIWFSTPDRGWLVGEDGICWHTADGGADWQPVAGVPDDVYFTDVFAFTDRGWAVCEGGRIFYFEQ